MMKMLQATVLVVVMVMSTMVIGANADCTKDVPLCMEPAVTIPNDICVSQTLNFTMDSCCAADSLAANSCPSNPEPTCRIVELTTPFSNNVADCCSILTLSFDWFVSSESCCKTCSCFGDPHCISFNDKVDSWIICDGRVEKPSASYGQGLYCPILASECATQLDQNGQQCVYNDNGKQSSGINGSPCQSASSPPATILMYKTVGFELLLTLGDRGIITDLALTDGNTTYYINSGTCVASNTPWRNSPTATKPPTTPWLPDSWTVKNVAGGKAWTVTGLQTGIDVEFHCILNAFGSEARINVDALSEPDNSRVGTGVCVTGVIDKGKSTYQHTYDITKFCRSTQTQGEAIEYFCDDSYLTKPAACANIMCAKIANGNAAIAQCVTNVMSYEANANYKDGWEREWCTLNVLTTTDPSQCIGGSCLQCMYDVYDFGWADAVQKWKNFNQGLTSAVSSNLPCIPVDQLNATLDDCQNGITIQYLNTAGLDEYGDIVDCWQDYLSIPEGRTICGGNSIVLNSTAPNSAGINFFNSQIRVKQCDNSALCPSAPPEDKCAPSVGVNAKLTLTPEPTTNLATLYWQLVREGKLVCAGTGGTACLENVYGAETQTATCTGCNYCPTHTG